MPEARERRKAKARGRGAPGRRRVPREVREREMVEVASRVFGERGYHEVSMDEVAEAAGVTKPMLYAYFESKEGLFAACQRAASRHLRSAVREAAAAEVPPDQRLFLGFMAVFTFIEEYREAWRLTYPPGGGTAGGTIGAGAEEARQAMSETLGELLASAARAEGLADQAAEHAAAQGYALTGATIGMASWWLEHPEEPKELQVLRLMNFAWVGLDGMRQGRLWVPPF